MGQVAHKSKRADGKKMDFLSAHVSAGVVQLMNTGVGLFQIVVSCIQREHLHKRDKMDKSWIQHELPS